MDSPSANRESSGRNFHNASNKSEVTSTSEATENTAVQMSYKLETDGHTDNVNVMNHRNEWLDILIRKDLVIGNLSHQLDILEKQLELAVDDRRSEGKEMDLHVELLSSRIEIENLTNNLNKNMIDDMTVRQEVISASDRFKIDLDGKSEQLRIAKVDLRELREINDMLTIKNEEYAYKLSRQLNESSKLIKHYDDELKAKTDLAEMYKENSDESQAYILNLTAENAELNRLLDGTYHEFRILETKLNDSELLNRNESTASNDIIVKLKQELHDANSLLKAYHNDDGISNVDSEIVDIVPNFSRRPLQKGMTFTEIYTQYRNVVKELQHKELECTFLELEMNNLIEDTQKASHLVRVLRDMRATDVDLDDSLLTETSVREAMENCRSRCESLTAENDEIKSTLAFYNGEEVSEGNSEDSFNINIASKQKIETRDHVAVMCLQDERVNTTMKLLAVNGGTQKDASTETLGSQSDMIGLERMNMHFHLTIDNDQSLLPSQNLQQNMELAVTSSAEISSQIMVAVLSDNEESSTAEWDILKSIVLGQLETPKPTPSLQADSLKRSISAQRARRSRQLNKRARPSFVESSEGSTEDEIIVCDDGSDQDLQDIELEFISEFISEVRRVRTRHQTQCINDAFKDEEDESSSNVAGRQNGDKASNPRRTCNSRSQSASQSLSPGNGQLAQAPQRFSDRQRRRNRTNEKD